MKFTYYKYSITCFTNDILIFLKSAKVKELEESKKSLQNQLSELQKKVSEVSSAEEMCGISWHRVRSEWCVIIILFKFAECQIGYQGEGFRE